MKGGLLIIEGRKEQVANPNYSASGSDWKTTRQYADYTSTSMPTSGLQSWQYGRFEMRARIPTSAGMWPAWWTLGVSGEWPSNGEIDIMEYYKGNVLANVACGTATRWTAKWDSSTKAISSLGSGWSSSFHIWRMDWDDVNISLYLDDTLMNAVPLSSMLNSDGTSPFKQKVYMILNLAIGGDNNVSPANFTGILTATTAANLALTKIGTGMLALSGSNSYGATTITAGTLSIGRRSMTMSSPPWSSAISTSARSRTSSPPSSRT